MLRNIVSLSSKYNDQQHPISWFIYILYSLNNQYLLSAFVKHWRYDGEQKRQGPLPQEVYSLVTLNFNSLSILM